MTRKTKSDTPTPRDIEFAIAMRDAGGPDVHGNLSKIGRLLRPALKAPCQWARRRWESPAVQRAYEAIAERNEQQIRVWAEQYDAGLERRVEVFAGVLNGYNEATNKDRMQAANELDEREGRPWTKKGPASGTATVGILEAIVLGRGGTGAVSGGGRLPSICDAVSLDSDQDTRLTALRVVAASIRPGDPAAATEGREPADVELGAQISPGRV